MKISIVLAALTGQFETDMNRASKTAQKRAREIERDFKRMGAAIGVGLTAAVGALTVITKNAIQLADRMDELSQRTGIATETLSGWSYAATLSGTSLESLERALPRLSRAMAEAQQEGSRMSELFKALWVDSTDAEGNLRRVEDVLPELADRFKALNNDTLETALAMELFGRSGAELMEFLNRGSDGITELTDKARDLGIVIDQETAAGAAEFNDKMEDMRQLVNALGIQLADRLLPALNDLVGWLSDVVREGDAANQIADTLDRTFRGLADGAMILSATIKGVMFDLIALYKATSAFGQISIYGLFDDRTFEGLMQEAGVAREMAAEQSQIIDDILSGRRGATVPRTRAPMVSGETDVIRAPAWLEDSVKGFLADPMGSRAAADSARDAKRAIDDEADAVRRLAEERFEQRMEMIRMAAEEREERERALAEGAALKDDLEFELELMKMTNAERATAIQLRGLDAEAIKAYGDEIAALNEQIEATLEKTAQMDNFRASFEDAFSSILDGSKSVKDAFTDLADSIIAQIARMIAQQWVTKLFGDPNTPGGGLFGDIVSSFFGGFRASGGPVSYGKAYIVGEQGPELFIPPGNGTIMNAAQTARIGQRGAQVINNFNMPGRYDLRTQAQIAATTGRTTQRALSRGTA